MLDRMFIVTENDYSDRMILLSLRSFECGERMLRVESLRRSVVRLGSGLFALIIRVAKTSKKREGKSDFGSCCVEEKSDEK